jgi:hypothetical protein
MKKPSKKSLNYTLIALFLVLIGWEMHVFKMWAFDVLNRAKVCDETNCQEILKMSKELNEYNLPVKEKK